MTDDDIQWGPTGQLVYERTYARTKPDGSKETWPETVERVVDGNLDLVPERHQLPGERDDLVRLMTEFKVLPAGRHLWASGVKNAQHLFNCWVSGWTADPADHFEFTFLRLMEGGGVGANYSNRLLPDWGPVQQDLFVEIVCDEEHPDYKALSKAGVLSNEYDPDWSGAFVIEDSREGWAAALRDLIETHYREEVEHVRRVYDVSRVREAGRKLRTFGGRASGPLPLARMLLEVNEVLSSRAYTFPERLTGMDAMEIDHAIAQCVVAGGVRRSARMSMMHWADPQIEDFLTCKASGIDHWTTNISVEVDAEFWVLVDQEHPLITDLGDGYVELGRYTLARNVLRTLTKGMVNNGEPGFWDSSLSNEGYPGEPNRVDCTNPCLTGDTVIATVNGPRTFADLAESGEDVEVYSWDPKTKTPVVRWMRRPHLTRNNAEILKVTFDSGLVVRCTPDHSFYTFRGNKVQAKDLMGLRSKSIRAFSASFDSSGHERVHGWDSKRNAANHQWTHRMIWENANGPIPEGMVIAHLDGDSSNNELSNLEMMTPYEHASYDYPARLANGFHHPANHRVVSVEPAGYADVYNGMVEDSHTYIVLDPKPVAGHMSGIVSANCGEITLEAWEPCNLGHVNLAAFVKDNGKLDTLGLVLAHRLITRFLIRATFSPVADQKSQEVLLRNRRIGVGHLGVASMLALTGIKFSEAPQSKRFQKLLTEMAEIVEAASAEYSRELRIPAPVKTRTVAPTGTIAKMPGVSEGIHPIFSPYFIRRVRFSEVDPDQMDQAMALGSQGYEVSPDLYSANTAVVSIPTKDSLLEAVEAIWGPVRASELVEGASDLTLYELLGVQEMYQTLWADNAVSFTANIEKGVDPQRLAAVLQHFGGRLKGATVFPETSMAQAPYERISKEQYEESVAKVVSDGVDEDCANGACPIR